MASSVIVAYSPAKLNLTLGVLGRRRDGFHELDSLVCGVTLRDALQAERAETERRIHFACDRPELNGPDNLVCKAAALLQDRFNVREGISLRLTKRIPVGAGMGGGSGNAAAALLLCDHVWGLNRNREELARVGAELGSDVPLFFSLPCARMRGRGEIVTPRRLKWSGWAVLVGVDVHVSTAEVYRRWRPQDSEGGGEERVARILEASSANELSSELRNDLRAAVFRTAPPVARLFDRLKTLGPPPFHLTGAGSTGFALCDDEPTAQAAARRVSNALPDVRVNVVELMKKPLTVETGRHAEE